MNKVAEINAEIQSQLLALPHSQPHLVGEGGGANTPGNQRLLGALEQLERRIRELEHSGASTTSAGSTTTFDGGGDPSLGVEAELVDLETGEADGSPSVGALMAKGQTMLNLDDAEQALECFDAVLKQDPKNADALLKKGTALERLRRMQEALDAYDAALAQDDSLTMAYLAKGGICNRMERYAEALDCYERALRVQQQGSV
jgi:tetratricopeptide (TPR) repeat protein